MLLLCSAVDLFNHHKELQVKYELNQIVVLSQSKEQGVVVGRAEYAAAEPSYLIRYKAADGRQVEAWWGESALQPTA